MRTVARNSKFSIFPYRLSNIISSSLLDFFLFMLNYGFGYHVMFSRLPSRGSREKRFRC